MQPPQNPSESTKRRNPELYRTIPMHGPLAVPVANETALTWSKQKVEEGLNKLEKSFLFELRRRAPEGRYGIQSIRLVLADNIAYTPDFWYIDPSGQLIFYETKGYMRDDARVKLRVAAREFPWARFVLVTRVKFTKQLKEEMVLP